MSSDDDDDIQKRLEAQEQQATFEGTQELLN